MPKPLPPSRAIRHEVMGAAFSRAAGASLSHGNHVALMIDARAHFQAWLAAIQQARSSIALENYIVRDDEVGRAFLGALVERAEAGLEVMVVCDWLGCLGESSPRFWRPLLQAGGQVRFYNPPQWGKAVQWISRDHRKVLVVDGEQGFLSGVCISAKWLGEPGRSIPPWRDTGVSLRGPVVHELLRAFAHSWTRSGGSIPVGLQALLSPDAILPAEAGSMDVRLIATQPAMATMFRVDQLIAAIARRSLWITDAYFVGVAPYVQALASAARDGVDVRLLVPGTSDIPAVAGLSRAGYRPLLQAGVRVFEWNGSMLHAKTAVADMQWARVGSSNLNIASWLNNQEIDLAIEDPGFAQQMATQYQRDLEQATEIVLARRRRRSTVQAQGGKPVRAHPTGGSSGRAAASAIRLANTVGAVIVNRRVLDDQSPLPALAGIGSLLLLAMLAFYWPALLAWPCAAIALWMALNMAIAQWRRRHRRR
ncbi:phospholipase D-like domain-containing protein [Frateuria aurantia]